MTEEYKNEFIFTLATPISFQDRGQAGAPVTEIRLMAPSNKQRRQIAKLKQGFFRALSDLQGSQDGKEQASDGKNEISGSEVLSIIMMSKIDYAEYQEIFKELLLGVGFVNDVQKVTNPIYEDISCEDSENMMGEYISNFLLSSWMRRLMSA